MTCDGHTAAEIREMAHQLHVREQAELIREGLVNDKAQTFHNWEFCSDPQCMRGHW